MALMQRAAGHCFSEALGGPLRIQLPGFVPKGHFDFSLGRMRNYLMNGIDQLQRRAALGAESFRPPL